ncbi:MAG: SxtJ family membrane protein [bacterium]|tara:strand:- start:809 stop:1207 length:399 start_codon:yes stop_codon:yes gene_type:complete
MDKATISVKQGSERNFGIVFSVVFLFFSFYPNFSYEKIRLWSLVVSVLFFLISIFQPSILKSLNFLWFKFGILLGRIISPIIMALVFVFAIIPTGIIIRLMGKDPLQRKFLKNKNSYWIPRKISRQSMKNQF